MHKECTNIQLLGPLLGHQKAAESRPEALQAQAAKDLKGLKRPDKIDKTILEGLQAQADLEPEGPKAANQPQAGEADLSEIIFLWAELSERARKALIVTAQALSAKP